MGKAVMRDPKEANAGNRGSGHGHGEPVNVEIYFLTELGRIYMSSERVYKPAKSSYGP